MANIYDIVTINDQSGEVVSVMRFQDGTDLLYVNINNRTLAYLDKNVIVTGRSFIGKVIDAYQEQSYKALHAKGKGGGFWLNPVPTGDTAYRSYQQALRETKETRKWMFE